MVSGVGLQDANGGVTGWERFLAARTGASLSLGDFITAYSVVGTALAGAALILLGLAMFLPIDHRPLGAVALVLSIGCDGLGAVVAGPRAPHVQPERRRICSSTREPGWYLFLIAGPIGIIGSIKALSTRLTGRSEHAQQMVPAPFQHLGRRCGRGRTRVRPGGSANAPARAASRSAPPPGRPAG